MFPFQPIYIARFPEVAYPAWVTILVITSVCASIGYAAYVVVSGIVGDIKHAR